MLIDNINLIGTINGDPTPMAIKSEDSGRDSMRGLENKTYMLSANGNMKTNKTRQKTKALIKRLRSSDK